ncbi:cytochrome P450 [Macrophomina phaseolina]|uniref:Cytochrome P450 n=1 Tax=Macrophomina phaseolina TaxID=35725 RepID=A0ABQ8FPI2_9PEZI|nr:cytochrome P450 [Macrophomina phaseolina]
MDTAEAFVCLIVYALIRLYHARRTFNNLREQGLPTTEWNWIFGGLLTLKKYMDMFPVDADTKYALTEMAWKSDRGGVYVDLWPFTLPILLISSPFLAAQVNVQNTNARRFPGANEGIERITGGPTMLTLPDIHWKQWRTVFNPGFSPSNILGQTSKIVRCVEIFAAKLRDRADKSLLFQLEEYTLRLTLDVIGAVALGKDFDYQNKDSAIPRSLRKMIEATTLGAKFNPLYLLNPMPALRLAYNDRIIRREIGAELEQCFLERKAGIKAEYQRGKSIITLAMDTYMTENKLQEEILDPVFKYQASVHLRLFMFAGHDTTSSTIIYTFHMLSQNPGCLSRIRAELDTVLGPDLSSAGAHLSNQPALANQMHYTTACIKETLRMCPPVGTIRAGNPDAILIDEDGTRYPTDGMIISVSHLAIHRNPRYYPDADTFNPERWLVPTDHPLHPPKEAFRPFEHGARNCIGQTLAMLELKIVLALTVREFDVVPAYEEWEKLYPSGGKIKTAFGDRAYGVADTSGGSHAVHKYPCHVKVRA